MDVLTRYRIGLLGIPMGPLEDAGPRERLDAVYDGFLDRIPYENLSNNATCLRQPGCPEAWPRTTDRFLREHSEHGLGGTSFSLAYALRDLFHGVGVNAHCALGHNLVTEESHACVIAFLDGGPLLYDPALFVRGPVEVRPGGSIEDPLGHVCLKPRRGATLTLCIRMVDDEAERDVYSIIPVPAAPQRYRQAWTASFYKGRLQPLKLARRLGDEIRRYAEVPNTLEILTCKGREQRKLPPEPVEELHELFGIDTTCLQSWFSVTHKRGAPPGG